MIDQKKTSRAGLFLGLNVCEGLGDVRYFVRKDFDEGFLGAIALISIVLTIASSSAITVIFFLIKSINKGKCPNSLTPLKHTVTLKVLSDCKRLAFSAVQQITDIK